MGEPRTEAGKRLVEKVTPWLLILDAHNVAVLRQHAAARALLAAQEMG